MAKLVFVCWGNICRSPLAERVARRESEERGLDVDVESFGISSEESGNPIDRRAMRTLTAHGYDASGHRARRVSAADLSSADIVVAVEPFQVDRLKAMGLFSEIVSWKLRLFVPDDMVTGSAVLKRLFERHPLARILDRKAA